MRARVWHPRRCHRYEEGTNMHEEERDIFTCAAFLHVCLDHAIVPAADQNDALPMSSSAIERELDALAAQDG